MHWPEFLRRMETGLCPSLKITRVLMLSKQTKKSFTLSNDDCRNDPPWRGRMAVTTALFLGKAQLWWHSLITQTKLAIEQLLIQNLALAQNGWKKALLHVVVDAILPGLGFHTELNLGTGRYQVRGLSRNFLYWKKSLDQNSLHVSHLPAHINLRRQASRLWMIFWWTIEVSKRNGRFQFIQSTDWFKT